MKLLKGIIGTTLLALTCVATSNIAVASSHENLERYKAEQKKKGGRIVFLCKSSRHKMRRQNNTVYCYYKPRGSNNSNMKGNDQRNVNRNTICKPPLRLYQNDAARYQCALKQPAGWRPVNQRRNNQNDNNQNYQVVKWKDHEGKRYADCPTGLKVFFKGNNHICAPKPLRGYRGYRGLVWSPNVVRRGGARVQRNNQYQYDHLRRIRNGRAHCEQGRLSYDKNYQFHCS